MKLIFIHGAPAVGKLTVACELQKLTEFQLFHNHLTVDLLLSIFEFGSDAFIKLREEIWLSIFREAAQQGISLIFTFCPERTVRDEFIQDTIEVVKAASGEVVFIELVCAQAEIESRIVSPSRLNTGKINSLEMYQELLQQGVFHFSKLPGQVFDTTNISPLETARLIQKNLS